MPQHAKKKKTTVCRARSEYHSCFIFQRCQVKFWLRDQILAGVFCVFPHFLQVNAVVHCHYCIWEQSCQFQPVLYLMDLNTFMWRMSWESGSLNLLELSGPHRACYRTPLPLLHLMGFGN
jgi:hypothetical protein